MISGRTERFHLNFPRLENNSIGDPAIREIIVHLPPKKLEASESGFPSVYFLPGWGSRGSKFLSDSQVFGPSFLELLENAMLGGELPAFVSVFVDSQSKLGCHQYLNSASLGPVQDWIAEDIPKWLESKYPCSSDPQNRIVAGHSSGGFGALHLGFDRPDRFQGIIAAAADSFFEFSLMNGLLTALQEINQAGGLENFLGQFYQHPMPQSQGSASFLTMLQLSLAACYAPRPGLEPLHGELFFDLETGAIRPDIWEEYLEKDPIRRMDKIDPQKLAKSFFVLDCGNRDEFGAQYGHKQIAKKMQAKSIPYHQMDFKGRHSGNDWRYVDRLKAYFGRLKN